MRFLLMILHACREGACLPLKEILKVFINMTPAKWLAGKRLELARNLLLNSDMNVNEVSFESGFKNPAHFNKVFREKYSLPPHQFRSRSGN